jgi:hypothetical protein
MNARSQNLPNDTASPADTGLRDLANQLQIIDARILALEDRLERGQRESAAAELLTSGAKPWYARVAWDQVPAWLQAVATPLMVALVGWWLSGSLELAIKQQEVDISGVKEMREALADLYADEPVKSKVDTAALSIAAFGSVAAGPLVEAYNLTGASRTHAAERGLVAAALRDKARVCKVLTSVAAKASPYSEDTRQMASKLQGDLRC